MTSGTHSLQLSRDDLIHHKSVWPFGPKKAGEEGPASARRQRGEEFHGQPIPPSRQGWSLRLAKSNAGCGRPDGL